MTVTRYKIKHFDVVSVGKIGAVVGAIIGLIYGILFTFLFAAFMVVGSSAGVGSSTPLSPLVGLGAAGIIILGLIGGAIGGFIIGIIYALVYNVSSSVVGPIEVDLES